MWSLQSIDGITGEHSTDKKELSKSHRQDKQGCSTVQTGHEAPELGQGGAGGRVMATQKFIRAEA